MYIETALLRRLRSPCPLELDTSSCSRFRELGAPSSPNQRRGRQRRLSTATVAPRWSASYLTPASSDDFETSLPTPCKYKPNPRGPKARQEARQKHAANPTNSRHSMERQALRTDLSRRIRRSPWMPRRHRQTGRSPWGTPPSRRGRTLPSGL